MLLMKASPIVFSRKYPCPIPKHFNGFFCELLLTTLSCSRFASSQDQNFALQMLPQQPYFRNQGMVLQIAAEKNQYHPSSPEDRKAPGKINRRYSQQTQPSGGSPRRKSDHQFAAKSLAKTRQDPPLPQRTQINAIGPNLPVQQPRNTDPVLPMTPGTSAPVSRSYARSQVPNTERGSTELPESLIADAKQSASKCPPDPQTKLVLAPEPTSQLGEQGSASVLRPSDSVMMPTMALPEDEVTALDTDGPLVDGNLASQISHEPEQAPDAASMDEDRLRKESKPEAASKDRASLNLAPLPSETQVCNVQDSSCEATLPSTSPQPSGADTTLEDVSLQPILSNERSPPSKPDTPATTVKSADMQCVQSNIAGDDDGIAPSSDTTQDNGAKAEAEASSDEGVSPMADEVIAKERIEAQKSLGAAPIPTRYKKTKARVSTPAKRSILGHKGSKSQPNIPSTSASGGGVDVKQSYPSITVRAQNSGMSGVSSLTVV